MNCGASLGTPLLKMITNAVVTTYYHRRSMELSPGKCHSLRRPRASQPKRYQHSISAAFFPFKIPSIRYGRKAVSFDFSPFQTHQWWAGRPFPLFPLLISASFHAINSPLISAHRPAHHYCAWNFPSLPPHDPSFPSEEWENIRLINRVREAQDQASLPAPSEPLGENFEPGPMPGSLLCASSSPFNNAKMERPKLPAVQEALCTHASAFGILSPWTWAPVGANRAGLTSAGRFSMRIALLAQAG